MVDKRRRLAPKPITPPPAADSWVDKGGLDPELQNQPSQPTEAVVGSADGEDKAKPYPHRISFDMATQQYRQLKRASFDSDRTMNDILREAVEEWLKTRGY